MGDQESADVLLNHVGERNVQFFLSAGSSYLNAEPELASCLLHLLKLKLGAWIFWIYQKRYHGRIGYQLVQEFKPLRFQRDSHSAYTRDVAARPIHCRNEPSLTGSLPV